MPNRLSADGVAVARKAEVVRKPDFARRDRHVDCPHGLVRAPPPGPAIPVVPIPMSAPKRRAAPSAIASATSRLTAPRDSMRSGGTPSSLVFDSFPYATTPPRK